jgi:hypothetical protein
MTRALSAQQSGAGLVYKQAALKQACLFLHDAGKFIENSET